MSYNNVTKGRVLAAPKKLIPIPLIGKDSSNTAAAACIDAILTYYGYELDREGINWSNLLAVTQEDGTGLQDMISYLNKVKEQDRNTNRLLEIHLNRYMTVCDLMSDIDKGILVVCPIQAWYKNESGDYEEVHDYREEEGCGHYVVSVGYDRDCIYFMDPSQSNTYTYIPINEMDARWHDVEGGICYRRAGIQIKLNNVECKASYIYKIM